jgi:FlgD Ig-like domain
MRHFLVRAAVFAALIAGTTLAYALSTGPVPSRTGAPAVANIPAELLCTVCHTGNAPNDPDGLLEILDVPDQYTPGVVYDLRVRLRYTHNPLPPDPVKWGFQLTAVRADSGLGVGTFIVPAGLQIMGYNPASPSPYKTRKYVEHTGTANHDGDLGPVEWAFQWTAPPVDQGRILFFAAGNAANGNGFNSEDHIFTARDTSEAAGNVDVPTLPPFAFVDELETPYPNPMTQCASISFTTAKAGFVDVAVFDVQGRRVKTVFRGHRAAGVGGFDWNGQYADGRRAPNGVYFVRLAAPGARTPLTQKITLAR